MVWRRDKILMSVRWKSRERQSATMFSVPLTCWE